MADVTVTIGAQDDGSLSSTISTAKAKLAQLSSEWSQTAHTTGPLRFGGPLGTVGEAQERGRKALEDLAQGFGKVTEAQKEVSEATGGATSQFERMFTRIAERLVIFEALRLAIGGVKEAFMAAVDDQTQFVQIQNMTGKSAEATEKDLNDLRKAAQDMGVDYEKVLLPAYRNLLDVGLATIAAKDETKKLAEIYKETGNNLTQAVTKAEAGTATFADLAKAATAFGKPDIAQWAHAWEVAQSAEQAHNREMERGHQLAERAIQDAERLANAQTGFASTIGLTKVAFADLFPQWRSGLGMLDPAGEGARLAEAQQRELRSLMSGELGIGMKDRMRAGREQLAKEMGVSEGEIGRLADLRLVGPEQLMAAAKRTDEEKKISDERDYQDQQYDRTKSFEHERVNANIWIRDAIHDQTVNQEKLNRALATTGSWMDSIKETLKEIGRHAGDVTNELKKAAPPETAADYRDPNRQLRGQALWDPRIRGQIEAMRQLEKEKTTGSGPAGGSQQGKTAVEDQGANSKLDEISKKLDIVFSVSGGR